MPEKIAKFLTVADDTEFAALGLLSEPTIVINKATGAVSIATGAAAPVALGTAAAPAANITDFAAITGGEAPTEGEFNALGAKVNLIIAALEAKGITASS